MREHTGWPTEADIADWQADTAAHARKRARRAAQAARYRKTRQRRSICSKPKKKQRHGPSMG